MDGSPPEDPDAPDIYEGRLQGCFPALEPEEDKKKLLWMGGVMDCFSTVFSLFSTADHKPQEQEWDIPYEKLSNLVYLGAGAQGIVFSGHYRGELVAVKQLRDRSDANIKHLRKLNHENIVQFKGISTDGPKSCIIMEFCQYGPLFEYIHSGSCFLPSQILKWAKEIAQGMTYLHSNKIIHRDLKSPNILIADNLVVKVSDFGTSREWNDVSAVMSFTGTVAWMAPEVIRNEPSSERVDVWSYGVVLWELLTQEMPYKNLETHAIMWGVGTDTIALPIPSTCPSTMQLLMNQCWNRTPRNRPPFKIIAANLEIAGDEMTTYPIDLFKKTQAAWRKEIRECMLRYYARVTRKDVGEGAGSTDSNRREDMKTARHVRKIYENNLCRANELYLEVCTVRLQLEQREKNVEERETALKACRCGARRNVKYHYQPSSSSSDLPDNEAWRRLPKKKEPAQVVVCFTEKKRKGSTVTVAVPEEEVDDVLHDVTCLCSSSQGERNNNYSMPQMKDTIVEKNGNIDIKPKGKSRNNNRNKIPEIAHV
uniref:Protein kinase domain-containing protein n=1 Tax=Heliothis virescens TaxID=7102 RepID=A0A2A4K5N2_HELVI